MIKAKKEKIGLVILIMVFISATLYLLPFYNYIFWDSATYIGMGKYVFSLGQSGLWEASRPLIWPGILGFIWKIGLNPIIFGKIAVLLFSIGIIYMTWVLGKEIFNEKIGLLAAVLMAFTPAYFLANSQLMTGIPSTFFAITGFYLFVKKRYFYSGLLLGIAFMTRFLQLYIFIFLIIYLIFLYFKCQNSTILKNGGSLRKPRINKWFLTKKKELVRNLMFLGAGFSIPVIPYLILNIILYGNPIYPFLLQSYLTSYTGWRWWEPFSFYFVNMFKENFFVLFSLLGIYLILRKKDKIKISILAIFLIYFVFYTSIIHKEMRFLMVILPYLYLITSHGVLYLASFMKNKRLSLSLLAILIVIWLIIAIPQIDPGDYDQKNDPYYEYLGQEDVSGAIWTTSPLYILKTNKKAELIYYPTFDNEKAKEMQTKILEAKHVLFNQCDILCPPWDKKCPAEKEEFIEVIKDTFKEVHYEKYDRCNYYIFTSS